MSDQERTAVYASLASQLGEEKCTAEDTEDMFWLRESDDYRSRFRLGSALAAQYRFRDAVIAFESALRIKKDDWKLWYSLSGAELTLGWYGDAVRDYRHCLSLGADDKAIAFPLGIAAYYQKDYQSAANWFEKCLPCGDETLISVIYWHTLACYRAGLALKLLGAYRADMQVGHHTAYRLAVSVLNGDVSWEQASEQVEKDESDLNAVIVLYGLGVYLDANGKKEESSRLIDTLLKRDGVWPCVAYLAAWRDTHPDGIGMTKEAVTAFFNRLAPHWDDDLVVDKVKINAILDAAGIKAGSRVLDVACGTGVLFPFYLERNVAHVTAVDISPEMAKIARTKTNDSRFSILCGDIEALNATGDYDCCVVYNAFPHFPEPARLIEKLAAWLKPGGRLTVAHGLSLEALNRHHSGSAAKVSRGMISTTKLTELFEKWFTVDVSISDDEKYIVSGKLSPQKGDDKK